MTILYMIKEGSQISGFCLFNKQRLGQQVSYLEKKDFYFTEGNFNCKQIADPNAKTRL